jgi:branched-chain amino acid aminotransferase
MHWLNGELFERGPIPLDPSDRGLLLGDGVFDTSLVLNAQMMLRDTHLTRLFASCDALGISIDKTKIIDGLETVLSQVKEAALRITITRGPGHRGLAPCKDGHPTVLISANSLARNRMFAPVTLAPISIRRNETSPTSHHKTLNYLDAVIGQSEAVEAGACDALCLNTKDQRSRGVRGDRKYLCID